MRFLRIVVLGCCVASFARTCGGCRSSFARGQGKSDYVLPEMLSVPLHDVQGLLRTPTNVHEPQGELFGQKLQRLRQAAELAFSESRSIPIFIDPALAAIRLRLIDIDSQQSISVYVPASMTFSQALDMLCSLVDARWLVIQGRILVMDNRKVHVQSGQALNVDFPDHRPGN